jgi:hypothetical protein
MNMHLSKELPEIKLDMPIFIIIWADSKNPKSKNHSRWEIAVSLLSEIVWSMFP